MNENQKKQIIQLRHEGYGYSTIATAVGINKSTIVAFCRKHNLTGTRADNTRQCIEINTCLNCGSILNQKPSVKKMKFCCDYCRTSWWNSHPERVNRKAVYTFICAHCEKKFTSYGNSKRKYCSHDCYIKARFKGGVYNE